MLADELNKITSEIESEFGTLDNIQLNWKPDSKSWSISQIISHMIIMNRKYFPSIERALSDKYKITFWERINPTTKYTGRQMIQNQGPEMPHTYQTAMAFRPPAGMIGQNVIEDFRRMQDELIAFVMRINENNKNRVITSPVANLVTLRLEDLVLMLVAHEKRHFFQAKKVSGRIDFPAS
jgi:hypothetical protein